MHTNELRARIDSELPSLIKLRHHLHSRPELGYQEAETSETIQRELAAIGARCERGLAGGTGVLAHLPATGVDDQRAVAIRADIDALPITEETGVPYVSRTEGVMHACGHDGHTAMVLGAARVLSKIDARPNPVTFLFQPAEEGGAGGKRMCDDGALSGAVIGPPVARIFGLHGWPDLPLGVVATRAGAIMASTDEFDIAVTGKQAHAAQPHKGRDPIVCAAHLITALQTIASRSADPLDATVVTIGAINAGTASNIIPQTARLKGTCRALTNETRRLTLARLREILSATAAAFGCEAELTIRESYPVTRNDPAMADHTLAVARSAVGESHAVRAEHPSMAAEDFAYYAEHVPACFFWLGLRPTGRDAYPSLHAPTFDFNDDALATGVEMFVRLALEELPAESPRA